MESKNNLSVPSAWFDLAKYGCASDLDICGWHWNIMYRLRLAQMYRPEPLPFPLERGPDAVAQDEQYFRKLFAEHLERPVVPRKAPGQSTGKAYPLVSDGTVSDVLYHAESILEEEKYADAFEAHKFAMSIADDWARDEAYRRASPLEDSASDFIAERFPASSRYVIAQIDIQAPIERLLDSFEEWVRAVKQRRNQVFSKKRLFKDTDFSKWARYKLLAYFDLRLWAQVENYDIPHDLYVKYLFPEREGDAISFFRKTVREEAEAVFTWECCEALAAQADIHL